MVFDAGENRDAAATQEAAAAGNLGRRQLTADQGVDETIPVGRTSNDQNEFQAARSRA